MFLSRNKKNNVYPCKPQFYYIKVGFDGIYVIVVNHNFSMKYIIKQDKIFRHKRLSTGANFVHVCIEIWDKGILKFNKFSVSLVIKNNNVILQCLLLISFMKFLD